MLCVVPAAAQMPAGPRPGWRESLSRESSTLTAWWDTYATDGYTAAKKQSAMVHELGHVLGLAHSGIGPCVSVPVMYPSTDIRYGNCLINTPKADDVNAVNFIY
ncbi:matrixin family metalloprotease [Micromonospora sp. NPDC094482]|uniref:matrixin family metalloprotease n=1 Tax=unclassified Micromonospora TaxID=2617518 RepID=UPI00332680FB